MLVIGEPPRTQFDLHFSISGIPVRVSPWFWLVGVLLGARGSQDGMDLLIWVAVVFVSILIHELGHAFTMRRFGESPRVVLYMLGGLAISGGDSPWRMAPSRPRNSSEQIIISAAGPAAGFAFAACVVVLVIAAGGQVQFGRSYVLPTVTLPDWALDANGNVYMLQTIYALLYVNIFWGLVNLLPVYPLDGGQISRELFTQNDPWGGVRKSLMLSMITGGAVAVASLIWLESFFIAIMFGLLAFSSWQTLQQMTGGGGFGGPSGGGRPW